MTEEKKEKITKDMPIQDVVRKYPQTAGVFSAHGLGCVGCAAAAFENIKQGAESHGIDVKKLVDDLNEAAGKESS